jgi:hypothetical protein
MQADPLSGPFKHPSFFGLFKCEKTERRKQMLEVGQARIPAQRSLNFWPAGWKTLGDDISRQQRG